MTPTRTHAALLLAALAGAAAVFAIRIPIHAQTQNAPAAAPQFAPPPSSQIPQPAVRPQPALAPTRAVIFLDPAHGGSETGASLGNNVAEKDVTVTVVGRLRPLLASGGFAIVTTRDSDLTDLLPADQRAEAANRAHALACIVVHATASGSGVHIFTSTLPPEPAAADDPGSDSTAPFTPIPWESAQAGFVDQSRRLSDLLKATLAKTGVPVLAAAAPLRPLDNLMCPAVAIEIAPRPASSGSPTPAADPDYQQQIVAAISSALQLWRTQNTPASLVLPGGAP